MPRPLALLLAVLLAPAAALPAPAAPAARPPTSAGPASTQPDILIRARAGERINNLQITKETMDKIFAASLVNKGELKTFSQEEIREIAFYDEPESWRQAKDAIDDGRWSEAIKWLKAAQNERGVRPWLEEYTTYYLALAYHSAARESGNASYRQEAVRQYEAYLSKYDAGNTKGKFAGLARMGLGSVHFDGKKGGEAMECFKKLKEGEYSMKFVPWGYYWEGRVAESKSQFQDAEQQYNNARDQLQPAGLLGSELHTRILSRIGFVQLAGNQAAAAEQTLKDVSELKNLKREHLAMTFNGLADAQYAQGKFRAALLNYLRVVVVHFDDREEHAKALYSAGECWKKLGKKEEAAKLLDELQKRYPESTWTSKAKGGE